MVQGSEEKVGKSKAVAVVGDPAGLKALVDRIKEQVAIVTPRGISGAKLLKVAQVAASRNPILYKCTPESVMTALMTAAELGLDPSGTLGQGYLVPFYNSQVGAFEAVFIAGYQGLISLAYRSGKLESIHAAAVFEGDEFDLELGTDSGLTHRPSRPPEGSTQETRYPQMIGAYVTWTAWGCTSFHWLWREEIEPIRQQSLAKQKGRAPYAPWTTHPVSMAIKTAVRAGVKWMPLSVEDFALFAQADIHEEESEVKLIEGPVIDVKEGDASFAPTPEEEAVVGKAVKEPKLV